MRFDNQTRSLHYFHSYGVRDRVNIDDYSDQFEPPDHGSIELTHILPSQLDDSAMLNNFSILIARILKKYMPFSRSLGMDWRDTFSMSILMKCHRNLKW